MKGVTECVDDILTRGIDSKDHDVNLLRLLETARMNWIKFNPKKLQFKTTECEFFGQTLTPMGMKIDDRKVEAVKQMQAPKDKKGLQSFQGMVNYLKRYSAQLTRPLFQPLNINFEKIWNGVGTPAIRRPSMPSKRSSPEPVCSRFLTRRLSISFKQTPS